jgi:hypothetical protein
VGVKQGDLLLKVFLLRLGVGGGRIFLKGKWVFSIKDFFLSGVGWSGDGGGIKKIFSGKNFRSRFGSLQQRWAMFKG